ncbi:Arylsulfatase A [Singulisphaera sp. GP187]|uniref:sulfatase family protein n=1 Tax=Singulisphaera sp. GP187 TaxID=1882752 RepID=UPI0009264337|nr:sulfatase [Singulisphaera sp. GP187]SIO22625.1 Arylsulfatase A [Singulisphaera sp. GP187]
MCRVLPNSRPARTLERLGAFLIVCGSLMAAPPPRVVAAEPTKQPNILFIFSDDHAYQAISAYNDPRKLIETPNIDRIATEGMRFDRCVVPNSICGPSRATVLTGKYSHANGFYNNSGSRFDGSQTTVAKLLKGAGYQTAVVGKWHLVSDPTGFDYWHILPGQGVYYNPPMIDNGTRVKHEGYTTDIITDLTIDWLKKRDKSKPFLMMSQHKAPHREWAPALRHLGHDNDRNYPAPATLFDDYAGRGKAEHDQDMTIAKTMTAKDLKFEAPPQLTPDQRQAWDAYYAPRNQAFEKADLKGDDLVRWKYNRYMHDYLACIKAVDESVGRLLKYLEDEGLAENTIVVYAADQGFYLGEHGWFDKRWIFEESLRTPFMVRWPGVTKPGSVNTDLVSNLDFAETFLEAAGQPVPAEMQGKSLVSVLKGRTPEDWRKSFYYHYYEYPGPHNVRRHYGVVTDRYKLVRFYGPDVDEWELFDLKEDPQELRSVHGQAGYTEIQKELEQELARLRKELNVTEQDPPESVIRPATPKAAAKKQAR